jgi:His/Glu/Gln/Arg/opine family amino acid ABC transporter permease subunit
VDEMTGFVPLGQPAIWTFLLAGLATTVQAAVLGIGLSLLLGVVAATARAVGPRWAGLIVTVLVQALRSLPSYLILLTLYFGVNGLGVRLSPLVAITLALGLYHGAKVSEIVRGAVQSVDRRQVEAARALGLGRAQTFWYVVLPQAARRMQPPLVSELVLCIKNTSLGALVGLDDLVRRGEIVYQKYVNPIETLAIVGLIYWVLCFSLTLLARRLERKDERGTEPTPARAVPASLLTPRCAAGHSPQPVVVLDIPPVEGLSGSERPGLSRGPGWPW